MYANATWTRPSNMSIITSLYPQGHGMVDPVANSLNPSVPTLPEILASRGYTTRFVSNDQIHMGIELGYKRMFEHLTLTGPTFDDETIDAWLKTIDSIREDNRKFKPSFVYFHTDHVHDYVDRIPNPPQRFVLDPTYRPPVIPGLLDFTDRTWNYMREYLRGSSQAYRVESTANEFRKYLARLERATTRAQAYRIFTSLPQDWQHDIQRNVAEEILSTYHFAKAVPLYRHLYDDNIRSLDLALGRVLARLEENDLHRNTIVVVTSDHGQVLGEFKLLGHIVTLAKQEIYVPLIVHVPGVAPQRRNELAQHIDIFPTILDFVGIPIPKEAQGISLMGLMLGKPDAKRNEFVISQTTLPTAMNTIVTDRWRLMEATYPTGNYRELFDRVNDPKETKSVAPLHQDVVERLGALLYGTLARQRKFVPITSTAPEWKTEQERQQAIHDTDQ